MNANIYLVPVGDVEEKHLRVLSGKLEERFGRCMVKPEIEMPPKAFNSTRRQYLSTVILTKLNRINVPAGSKILGVADADLYVPELNFVFGEAFMGGKCAVIALARLKPEFYGLKPDENLFHRRMVKEAVHELGHTFGLKHCKNRTCVMCFSNSLRDTDIKSDRFCQQCLNKLKRQREKR